MVYVFGIPIPLMELLLIFFILLTASLGFILVELKKLRNLLLVERNVVKQFEQDLAAFEQSKGKTKSDQLEAYIKSALGQGMPKEKVKEMLVSRGWNNKTIEKTLDSL